jgi:hypothetical protein
VEVTLLPKPELACFVIADISGYTKFLAASAAKPQTGKFSDFIRSASDAA